MTGDRHERLLRIASVIAVAKGADPARELCRASVALLRVSGVSLVLISDGLPVLVSSSDRVAARLEELQHTLGEGPSIDAHAAGRPVTEPNLPRPRHVRWIAFGSAAVEAGVAAVFSFPLRVGGVRLGAVTLSQAVTGGLSDDQHADAQAVASLATVAILEMQVDAPAGMLGAPLELLTDYTAAMHQACGMVSVQLGVGVGDALVRLRAHAFASGRPLASLADDVISRRLRFGE